MELCAKPMGTIFGIFLLSSLLAAFASNSGAQSSGFELYFPSEVFANANENLTITGTIANTGMTADTAFISASAPSNWSVSVYPSAALILAGANESVRIDCMVPSWAMPGTYDIVITVCSNLSSSISTNISVVVGGMPPAEGLQVTLFTYDHDNDTFENDLLLYAEICSNFTCEPASGAMVDIDGDVNATDIYGSFQGRDYSFGEHRVFVSYTNANGTYTWNGTFTVEGTNEPYLSVSANSMDLDGAGLQDDIMLSATVYDYAGNYSTSYYAANATVEADGTFVGYTDAMGFFMDYNYTDGEHLFIVVYSNGNMTLTAECYVYVDSSPHASSLMLDYYVDDLDGEGAANDLWLLVYVMDYTNCNGTYPAANARVIVDYYQQNYTDADGIFQGFDYSDGLHYFLVTYDLPGCNGTNTTNCSITASGEFYVGAGWTYLSLYANPADLDGEGYLNDVELMTYLTTNMGMMAPAAYSEIYIDGVYTGVTDEYGYMTAYGFEAGYHSVYAYYTQFYYGNNTNETGNVTGTYTAYAEFYSEGLGEEDSGIFMTVEVCALDNDTYADDAIFSVFLYSNTIFIDTNGSGGRQFEPNATNATTPDTPAEGAMIYVDYLFIGTTSADGKLVAYDFSTGWHFAEAYYGMAIVYVDNSTNGTTYDNCMGNCTTGYDSEWFYAEGNGTSPRLGVTAFTFANDDDMEANDVVITVSLYEGGCNRSLPAMGIEVYIAGVFVGYTSENGTLYDYDFPTGVYDVLVYGNNCTAVTTFEVYGDSNDTWYTMSAYVLDIDNDTVPNDVWIVLRDADDRAVQGASIFIDWLFWGTTNAFGELTILDFAPGFHVASWYINDIFACDNCSFAWTRMYTACFYVPFSSDINWSFLPDFCIADLDNDTFYDDLIIVLDLPQGTISNVTVTIDGANVNFTYGGLGGRGVPSPKGRIIVSDIPAGMHDISVSCNGATAQAKVVSRGTGQQFIYALAYQTNANGVKNNDAQIVVRDQDGKPVAGATVMIDASHTGQTNQYGVYIAYDLDKGAHTGTVSAPGGRTATFIVNSDGLDNRRPLANAGADKVANAGQVVNFDSSLSIDPDGDALTYSWNFGDGSTCTGASPQHVFTGAGPYTVTLTVSDGILSASDTLVVRINKPPIANAGSDMLINIGGEGTFNASLSADPDGDALTYSWNFGDGSTGAGASPKHAFSTYPTNGEYIVTLTVTDAYGLSATATIKVRINRPPVASIAPLSAKLVGSKVIFDGLGSSDADSDGLTYTWEFGDGSTGTGASPSHVYKKPGTYDVKLTVSDGRGGISCATMRMVIKEHTTTGYPMEIITVIIVATLGAVGLAVFFRSRRAKEV